MHGDSMRFAVAMRPPGSNAKFVGSRRAGSTTPTGRCWEPRPWRPAHFPVGLGSPQALTPGDRIRRSEMAGSGARFEEDGRISDAGFRAHPPGIPRRDPDNPGFQYDFLCVDGGAVDNEPLEQAAASSKGIGYSQLRELGVTGRPCPPLRSPLSPTWGRTLCRSLPSATRSCSMSSGGRSRREFDRRGFSPTN